MQHTHAIPTPYTAALVLADGSVFYGYGIGAHGETTGEVCFNTGMTGYQEVLTDPSYAGQIITFTFPHIGNVGTNPDDRESLTPAVRGLIVREKITSPSNFRNQFDLESWLKEKELTGICGIDTRRLTRLIRKNGAQNVSILYPEEGKDVDINEEIERLKPLPSLAGMELAKEVSCQESYEWKSTRWSLEDGYGEVAELAFHVVAIDYGEKLNILRSLASYGCKVTIVPSTTPADQILALKPDGVFLSNGPGDPAATGEYAIPVLKALIAENLPIFGICLGHQLLALALGAKTEKMHQGHRGANHPVKRVVDNTVEITSQNHGFVVSHGSLPDKVNVTHLSLFDGTIEGLEVEDKPVFSVQYHPESSPGPHDSLYLFQKFVDLMREHA
ncbi:MAG: glutamine-hydrolyzing carbamoyl-phosphate synthase small subunit [Rickettsiales bacterium]|nr:glutamine-hydrolyzing carbamoyl-phosphate synthase small subunit [Rickettsiales bacterium]